MIAKNIPESAIQKLQPIIMLQGSESHKLGVLRTVLSESEIGLKGVEEVDFILNKLNALNLHNPV